MTNTIISYPKLHSDIDPSLNINISEVPTRYKKRTACRNSLALDTVLLDQAKSYQFAGSIDAVLVRRLENHETLTELSARLVHPSTKIATAWPEETYEMAKIAAEVSTKRFRPDNNALLLTRAWIPAPYRQKNVLPCLLAGTMHLLSLSITDTVLVLQPCPVNLDETPDEATPDEICWSFPDPRQEREARNKLRLHYRSMGFVNYPRRMPNSTYMVRG